MDCLPHIHVAAFHAEVGQHVAVTPGLGIVCRSGDLIGGAGIFRNSVDRVSKYATVGWQPLEVGGVRVGAFGGYIDGYKTRNAGGMSTFGGALLSTRASIGEVHLTIIPAAKTTPLTLGVSFAVHF